MSGGSYDYAYGRFEDFAGAIRDQHSNPLRRAFAAHMRIVAKAAHAIEWVDSHDYGSGDEDAPIRAVLSPGAELEAALETAREAREMLDAAIARAEMSGEK